MDNKILQFILADLNFEFAFVVALMSAFIGLLIGTADLAFQNLLNIWVYVLFFLAILFGYYTHKFLHDFIDRKDKLAKILEKETKEKIF